MEQLHKRFQNNQVKDIMKRYVANEIKREHVQGILRIGRRQFFKLLKEYRRNPDEFSIEYLRTGKTRSIDTAIEKNILAELKETKKLIVNKDMPVWTYNYSFIQKELLKEHKQIVSVPTIIRRAKKHGFYIKKSKTKKSHDRYVITNHIGELVQHDASIHLWSPWAKEKWVLITSIDDFSRFILYAMLVAAESAWVHILALQSIFLKFGLPMSFYVDSHSIFRFVRGRDELHYRHHKLTDEIAPQWKQVLDDCKVDLIYALSPQAKGKVERPYGWLQDHIVRICARDHINTLPQANQVLFREVYQYNHKWIHSTTEEIPFLRFQRAEKENKNLFRQFIVPPPYQSIKDIFCFRMDRVVDNYRSVSVNNLQFKFNNAPIRENVNLRIHPNKSTGLSEVRFWHQGKLLDVQKIKTTLLENESTFRV
ncbi:MAG: hypothetical protein WC335_04680 [Candidatus Omnitrophota bacterium]|jgi:hypothetical protein